MPIDPFLLNQVKNNSPTLVELDLTQQTPPLTAADMALLAESLSTNTHLHTLRVKGNQIGDAGAAILAKLSTLTTLDVRDNDISPNGILALAQSQTLTTVYVADKTVKTTTLPLKLDIERLAALNLDDFRHGIENKGVQALAPNRGLKSLTQAAVYPNIIDDQCLQVLEQQITANRQAVQQQRTAFLMTTYILLRQGQSLSLPLELWQQILSYLNFPSLAKPQRSGEGAVAFIAEHLEEFKDRLTAHSGIKLLEYRNPLPGQSRFAFFTPSLPEQSESAVVDILNNPQLKPKT